MELSGTPSLAAAPPAVSPPVVGREDFVALARQRVSLAELDAGVALAASGADWLTFVELQYLLDELLEPATVDLRRHLTEATTLSDLYGLYVLLRLDLHPGR